MSIESNKLMNLADAKVLYDDLRNRQEEKLDKPSVAGTNGQVLTSDGQGGQSWQTPSGGGSGGAVDDVQINGTSVVSGGVANVPKASTTNMGAIKTASNTEVKAGTNYDNALTPFRQHMSTFYGLATAAGDSTQASSNNAVGTYTAEAKAAIQKMLSAPDVRLIATPYEELSFPVQAESTICTHDNLLYMAIEDIATQEDWNSAHWFALGTPLANMMFSTATAVAQEVMPSMGTIMSSLAPSELSFTATRAYSVGDLFVSKVRGQVYKVTAAIAVGDTIVPGSSSGCNCIETDLSTSTVHDVQMNGTSLLSNGVANIPTAGLNQLGVISIGNNASTNTGIYRSSGSYQATIAPATDSDIKSPPSSSSIKRPIIPYNQHQSVFYGLAKAAGDTTQASSENAVGTYTSEAKAAIKTMLGVTDPTVSDVQVDGTSVVSGGVANIPIASSSAYGTVKISSDYGIKMESSGVLSTTAASDSEIKAGGNVRKPITPYYLDKVAYYGLAKAAGADLKNETVTIGTYPAEAKAAIQSMLGVEQGVVFVEEVTGTTPTITGVSNTRYICGEVSELTITPPGSGIIDVRFTSGTTPTVLTIPSTVKFPDWVDLTTIEASTVYEIMITDGVYGAVMTWPV